jgi:DNA-binding response OmpR family regulator
MPEMDGYQATIQLKANSALKNIPVIAVTASSFREEEARARKACDGFIRKPFNRAELIAELQRFLKQAHAPGPPPAAPRPPPESGRATVVTSVESLAKRPHILAQLRDQQQRVWPELCQSLAMDEIEQFARRLRRWADEGHFPELDVYAEALLHDVDTFDVDRLPQKLEEFPSVCASINTLQ